MAMMTDRRPGQSKAKPGHFFLAMPKEANVDVVQVAVECSACFEVIYF